MTDPLQRSVVQELAARLEFYRELGIYDLYRRGATDLTTAATTALEVESLQISDSPAPTETPSLRAVFPATISTAPASLPPAIPAPIIPAVEESTIPRRTLVSNQ